MRCRDTDALIGVLAGGTGNLLARALGIPLSVPKAVDRLLDGQEQLIDLGRFPSGRRFAIAAGVGIDAAMVAETPGWLKRRLGVLAYTIMGSRAALRSVLRRQFFATRLVVDGQVYERQAAAVMIANFGAVLGNRITLGPGDSHGRRLSRCLRVLAAHDPRCAAHREPAAAGALRRRSVHALCARPRGPRRDHAADAVAGRRRVDGARRRSTSSSSRSPSDFSFPRADRWATGHRGPTPRRRRKALARLLRERDDLFLLHEALADVQRAATIEQRLAILVQAIQRLGYGDVETVDDYLARRQERRRAASAARRISTPVS